MKKTWMVLIMSIITAQGSSTYTLATGEEGADRLKQQHEVMLQGSIKHLEKAGLSSGQTVMDIGCGGGDMTLYFAKAVGPTGQVYAIDASDAQLKVTQDKVDAAGFKNVTYVTLDIENPDVQILAGLQEKADIAYTRLVLMHLKKPEVAVDNIRLLLKKGGYAVGQESMFGTTSFIPAQPTLESYVQKRVDLGKKIGQDYNIGTKLDTLFAAQQLQIIDYYTTEFRRPLTEAIVQMRKGFEESKQHFLDQGMTKDELLSIQSDLSMKPSADSIIVLHQGYVVAQKT